LGWGPREWRGEEGRERKQKKEWEKGEDNWFFSLSASSTAVEGGMAGICWFVGLVMLFGSREGWGGLTLLLRPAIFLGKNAETVVVVVDGGGWLVDCLVHGWVGVTLAPEEGRYDYDEQIWKELGEEGGRLTTNNEDMKRRRKCLKLKEQK
jgi:hypothetical protein